MFQFVDEAGADADGVSREAYTAFWSDMYLLTTSDETDRVPTIHPDFGLEEWSAVGRIIAKGFKDVRVFPTRLSPACVIALVHGERAVTPDLLMDTSRRSMLRSSKKR